MSTSTEQTAERTEDLSLASGSGTENDRGAAKEENGEKASSAEAARPDWPVVDWLPIALMVGLPVPQFRVRDLLALEPGGVVVTQWPHGEDLPLSAGDVQLAWVDVEMVEQKMSVRLTRLL